MFAYNWAHENCPLYGVAGCPLFRGCLSIEVNGRVVGTFRFAWVSTVEGCLLSRGSTVHVCGQYTIKSSNSFSRSAIVGAKLKFTFHFCYTVVLPYEMSRLFLR